jgi:hypothetical protein
VLSLKYRYRRDSRNRKSVFRTSDKAKRNERTVKSIFSSFVLLLLLLVVVSFFRCAVLSSTSFPLRLLKDSMRTAETFVITSLSLLSVAALEKNGSGEREREREREKG